MTVPFLNPRGPRASRARAAELLVVLLLGSGLAACGTGQAARPSARPLPADSAALLARALKEVRPAYRTQDEALAAGIYATSLAHLPRRDSAMADRRRDAPPALPRTGRADTEANPTPPRNAPPIPAPPDRTSQPEGGYVVQVAAFRDEASALGAAARARREFPLQHVIVEEREGFHRLALGTWPSREEAEQELVRIRSVYPSAWVRLRSVP